MMPSETAVLTSAAQTASYKPALAATTNARVKAFASTPRRGASQALSGLKGNSNSNSNSNSNGKGKGKGKSNGNGNGNGKGKRNDKEKDNSNPAQVKLYRSFIRTDDNCVYCGDAATAMDHFRAFMQSHGRPSGFRNDMWNMVPCCITCNSSKGNRSWRVFMSRTSGKTPLARGVPMATHRRRVRRLDAFERTGNKYVKKWASNKFATQLDALRTSMLHAMAKHAVVIRRLGLNILKYEEQQRMKKAKPSAK